MAVLVRTDFREEMRDVFFAFCVVGVVLKGGNGDKND